jgi:hypothetical protein
MTTESLLIKEGLAGRVGQSSKNSLQTGVLPDSIEHLPAREGLDVGGRGLQGRKWLEQTTFAIAQLGQ